MATVPTVCSATGVNTLKTFNDSGLKFVTCLWKTSRPAQDREYGTSAISAMPSILRRELHVAIGKSCDHHEHAERQHEPRHVDAEVVGKPLIAEEGEQAGQRGLEDRVAGQRGYARRHANFAAEALVK